MMHGFRNIKCTVVFPLNLEFQWHTVPPPGSDTLTGYFHLISTGNGRQTASCLHQLLNDYGSCGMKLARPQPGAPDCGLRDQYPHFLKPSLKFPLLTNEMDEQIAFTHPSLS